MTTNLRIHLLGPFAIELDGQSLTNQDWRTQQTQKIGKILLSHSGNVVTSDQLIDLVWPHEPVEAARRRLHVRISQLRKVLQDKKSLVRTVHGGYLFQPDPSCWIDVDAFQSALTEGAQYQDNSQLRQAILAYEQARQLYRGDFLAEDLYADWTLTQREFYRERFLSLLIQLSECYAQQGRYRLAIARARQALDRDPLRETIYVRLMLYHYYAGDRTQALRLFERCCQVLESDLDVLPLESTKYLAEQIRSGTLWKNNTSPRYPPPLYESRLFEVPYALDEIPFIGRDREFTWLESQWKDPTKRVILLAGEAGIGKSRLSMAFAGFIQAQGARVLPVRLAPDEQTPTSAILDVLRQVITTADIDQLTQTTLASLAQRFPELHQQTDFLPQLTPLPPQAEYQRLTQAISALAQWCATTPTLLIVDDAHRLNATAVALLTQLRDHIKLLLTFREEETPIDHPLRRAFGSAGLILKPLPQRAIQEIILQLSGDLHSGLADQISNLSRGNPLFMVTLLQQMFETGQLFVNPKGAWELTNRDAPALPSTLQAALEAHLQKLDPAQRRIMDYAAVMGGEFNFDLMQTASKQAEDSLLSILDDLLDSALLIENRSPSQAEYHISHDRYTEITYKTIPAVRRKHLHLRIAQALETLYAGQLAKHYGPLADHYHQAQQPGPAAQYAALAGEQAAAQFTGYEALHYIGLALSLLPPEEHLQRAHMLLTREQVCDLGGMRTEQEADLTSLQAISSHLPLAQQAEIELRLGAFEWIMGRNPQAKAAVEKAIGHARASKAKLIEARALLIAGKAASDGVSQAVPYLEQARILAQENGQRSLEGEIIRWLGNINFWQNNYEQSHTHLAEALTIHREVGDFRGELSALNNLGQLFEVSGQLQKAIQFYEQALDICQKIGDRLAEGVIFTNIGGLRTKLGHFAQAQGDLQRALVIRSEIGNDEGVAVVYHDLGDVFRHQGQYQCAISHYQKAVEINTRIQHARQKGGVLTALSVLYRDLGDYKLAREYVDQALVELTDQDSTHHIQALIEESMLNHMLGEYVQALTVAERALAKSAELLPLQAAAHKNAGHALAGMQRWVGAQENYLIARDLLTRLGQHHLTAEPLAGLAHIALINADLAAASGFTEAIFDIIKKGALGGQDRRLWIYLICWKVMDKTGDSRRVELIEWAYALLQHCADSISEDTARAIYLERIPENCQITEIWQGLHPSK